MNDHTPWRSQGGLDIAAALQTHYARGLYAFAEFDRISHLLLHRAGSRPPATQLEEVVGIAMLRRAVTLFSGTRVLLESSLPDVAKLPARAYFELWLNFRCIAYGSAEPIALQTATTSADREPRARRYYVAAERRSLRTRAAALSPGTKYPPPTQEDRDNLLRELRDEIDRLKNDYPSEWAYFGDVDETTVLKHVSGRNESAWFAAEFTPPISSVARLAEAFDYGWEYDVLYDAFSALVHSRGTGHDLTMTGNMMEVHHPHDPSWFEVIGWVVSSWHVMLLMTAAKWMAPEMIPQLQDLLTRHRADLATLEPTTLPNLLA